MVSRAMPGYLMRIGRLKAKLRHQPNSSQHLNRWMTASPSSASAAVQMRMTRLIIGLTKKVCHSASGSFVTNRNRMEAWSRKTALRRYTARYLQKARTKAFGEHFRMAKKAMVSAGSRVRRPWPTTPT